MALPCVGKAADSRAHLKAERAAGTLVLPRWGSISLSRVVRSLEDRQLPQLGESHRRGPVASNGLDLQGMLTGALLHDLRLRTSPGEEDQHRGLAR